MPFFGTTTFAALGLGVIAAAVLPGSRLWWLRRAETVHAQWPTLALATVIALGSIFRSF